jgi:hypothetical protein
MTIPVHIPSVQLLRDELQENNLFAKQDSIYIEGFFFSAEILANGLKKLAKLRCIPIQ